MIKTIYSNSAVGFIYIICSFSLFYVSVFFNSSWGVYSVNILSTGLFIFLLLFFIKNNIDFMATNAFLLINYIWFAFSLNLLEFGAYTPELEITGTPTGATARFIFGISIFLIFSCLGYGIPRYKEKILTGFQCRYVIVLFCMVEIGISIIYLIKGTALSNHVDRVVFRNDIAPPGYFQMLTVMTFLCYPLGRIRKLGLVNRIKLDAIFLLSIILLIMGGEKFSLLILAICLYVIAHKDKIKINHSNIFKLILICIGLFTVVFFLVSTQYKNSNNSEGAGMVNLMFNRVSQQAQLNYFFDKEVFYNNNQYDNLNNFISNELITQKDNLQGIRLLMSMSAPKKIFESYDKTGITFGDGFPAIFYLYFSWWSFMLMGVVGFFMA